MWVWRRPSRKVVENFLDRQGKGEYSYLERGCTKGDAPRGYEADHRRSCLGEGPEVYEAACQALKDWEMFNLGWVELFWPRTAIRVGQTVAVAAHWGPFWWLNTCKIVYAISDDHPVRRFGFAYGTLGDHAERGEERFLIEWLEDNTVWYDLLAFSKPRHWLVRLGYPLVRRIQKRFASDSHQSMKRAVGAGVKV